jgi:tRNA 2-thiouridine synthesizing protein D
MQFAIAIYGPPYTYQASASGLMFARAVLSEGHSISRIFFYHDGVYNANRWIEAPQDETDITAGWRDLARSHDLDMVVCVASALRRGMLDPTEASRYEHDAASVAPEFTISGLGQLIDAAIDCDRLVTFGV